MGTSLRARLRFLLPLLVLATACGGPAMEGSDDGGLTTYLVLFAHERVGMDERLAGPQFALVGLVAIASRVAWPMVAERAALPAESGLAMLRRVALAAAGAVTVIALATVLGAPALWAGAVLAGLSSASWNALAMLVVVRTSAPEAVAGASARVQGAFFLGLTVSPLVFGALTDLGGSYPYGWAWTGLCFLAAWPLLRHGPAAVGLRRGRRRPR
ncbi:hypothetical protein [Streptomyces sp. SBT349]|uniref:hypothetical protein n=1 Tax=Streptomyces sp. SBT349 TaxID=1580539 RepID=UPI00066DF8A0|nr:hypothetical protein [Streptomyces sp. SBT349]